METIVIELVKAKPNRAVFAPNLEEYPSKTDLVQAVIIEVDEILAYMVRGDEKD